MLQTLEKLIFQETWAGRTSECESTNLDVGLKPVAKES